MRYIVVLTVFLAGCAQVECPHNDYWSKSVRACAVAYGWKDLNVREQIQPAGGVRVEADHYRVKLAPEYLNTCKVEKETFRVLSKEVERDWRNR